MGGGSETDSHSTTTTELPQWVQDAGKANYGVAQGLANAPNPYYQGPTTSDTTFASNVAKGSALNNLYTSNTQAQGVLGGLLNYNPNITAALPPGVTDATGTGYTPSMMAPSGTVAAGQLKGTDLSPYMNPYIDDVVKGSMTQLNQQAALTANNNSARAAAAGAFGGTRAAVQQGVADAQTAQNAGLLSSQLYSAGYDNAQAAATGDINRRMAADTTNVSNANAVNQFNANAANSAGAFGATAANNASSENAAATNAMGQFNSNQLVSTREAQDAALRANYGLQLQGIGGAAAMNGQSEQMANAFGLQQQQTNQAALSGQIAQYNQNAAYPQQQLGLLESALGMTPYNTTTQSDGTVTKSQSPDFASIGMGALKMFNPFSAFMG